MMRHSRWTAMAATLVGLGILLGGNASAQVNAESFAKLGFNFSPPGARSAAMGGAFIPLADDATAAESNPAGLTVLLNPQISLEFKGIRYTRRLAPEAGGRPDTGSEFQDERGFPSFASAVYPTERATVGLFRHELVNYRGTLVSNGAEENRLFPFTSIVDLKVENIGGAVAVELGSEISLGIAAGISRLDLQVDFPRYGASRLEQAFLQSRLEAAETGSDFFVNAGLMWRPDEVVSIGAVFKRRPSFEGIRYRLSDFQETEIRTVDGVLKVPDSFGAGISVRVTELLTVSADAVMNRYSQLASEQAVAYEGVEGEEITADDYRADDGADLHLGLEYILLMGETPLSLRGGASRMAPSNTYYVGLNRVERDLWGTRPMDSSMVFSVGAGLVLLRRFQIEAAGVFGDDRDEFVASLVYYLGER